MKEKKGLAVMWPWEIHLSLTCKGAAPQQPPRPFCPDEQMDLPRLASASDVGADSGEGNSQGLLGGACGPPWGGKAGPGLGKGT